MKVQPPFRLNVRFISGVCLVLLVGALVVAVWSLQLSIQQHHNNAALIAAVKHEEVTRVQAALRRGAEANARDMTGVSSLSFWQYVQQFFARFHKQSADAPAQEHQTALELAVRAKSVPIVKALLDSGADPNILCEDGDSLLILAQSRPDRIVPATFTGQSFEPDPHEEAVTRQAIKVILHDLLQHGADVNRKTRKGDNWPLMYAAAHGDTEVVRILLDRGANVNIKDHGGDTALIEATPFGSEAVIRMLLEKGADVNAKEADGDTPLILATTSGYDNIVRLLLEFKADISAKNDVGDTALTIAQRNKYEAIVRLLQKR